MGFKRIYKFTQQNGIQCGLQGAQNHLCVTLI